MASQWFYVSNKLYECFDWKVDLYKIMYLIKVRLTQDNNLDTSEIEKPCNQGKPEHRFSQEQTLPKLAGALRSVHFS